jgi:hypothetical protein
MFKIYGERNTGTNLLREIVSSWDLFDDDIDMKKNIPRKFILKLGAKFPNLYNHVIPTMFKNEYPKIIGWKHKCPDLREMPKNVRPICIVKHPYFWLRSVNDKPFEIDIRSNVYTPTVRENLPGREFSLLSMLQYKYQRYFEVCDERNGIIVQYETLLFNTSETLKRLNKVRNLDLSYEIPDLDVRPFVKRSSNFREKYKAEKVPELAIRFDLHEEFDATLNKLLGYTKDSWEKKLPIIL